MDDQCREAFVKWARLTERNIERCAQEGCECGRYMHPVTMHSFAGFQAGWMARQPMRESVDLRDVRAAFAGIVALAGNPPVTRQAAIEIISIAEDMLNNHIPPLSEIEAEEP